MILIGDKLIPYENIYFINSVNDIEETSSNSTVSFRFNEKLLNYCFKNSVNSAVLVSSIKEAIYANALNAKYIIAKKDLAKKIQKIAENYMYDSKILAIINSNNELEEIASLEIDGVIYSNLLTSLKTS
ncbi:MAG: hypothetical protein ACQERD_11905 [Campylobacterota bacterium]